MSKQDRMSEEEIAKLNRRHSQLEFGKGHVICADCRWEKWPCQTARLLAENKRLRAALVFYAGANWELRGDWNGFIYSSEVRDDAGAIARVALAPGEEGE